MRPPHFFGARRKCKVAEKQTSVDNTLKEYLSKIRKCFSLGLSDNQLLTRYIISGSSGKPYRIDLPDNMVTLTAAVTN